MPDVLVSAKNLVKEYSNECGVTRVVDDVSFEIARGETLGLVGESGSGKSTVARMILRLIEPDVSEEVRGSVSFDGIDILKANAGEMRDLRRRMQIVFQDPYAALNPRMTVREIVGEPFAIHEPKMPDRDAKVDELLREVGLDGSALNRYPHEFSGGQRQRINIARALALRPEFLVLDEPVSALDVERRRAGHQSAQRVAACPRHDLSLHLALHAAGALSGGPRGRARTRPAGGDRRLRAGLRASARGVHAATYRCHAGDRGADIMGILRRFELRSNNPP